MAWPVSTRATDDLITAAIWNADIAGNMNLLPHLLARKAADESVTSSTVLQSDDELVTPSIGANEVWSLYVMLRFQSGVGDLKYSWQFPASGNMLMTTVSSSGLSAAELTASDTPTHALVGTATPRLYRLEAQFTNAGTPGVVTFRWAQSASNGTATIVKANSSLWGVKLG